MPKPKLDRRTFLRGAALGGIAVALPPLEAMFDTRGLPARVVRAQPPPAPSRLVVFHWPDGCHMPDFIPAGTGASWSSPLLAALDAHRADINVVTGVSGPRDGHEEMQCGVLTGTTKDDGGATGPSVDAIAAPALRGDAPFDALRVTLNDNGCLGAFHKYLCWSGPGSFLPNVVHPAELFDEMFSGLAGSAGSGAPSAAVLRRRSVLDFVRGDVDAVRRVCGIGDRRILDEHLDGIRDLETSLAALATAECALPETLATDAAMHDGARSTPCASVPDEEIPARVDLFLRMAVLAMRCDLTRVVVISLGYTRNDMQFPWLGLPPDQTDHSLSHHMRGPWDPAEIAARWAEIRDNWNRVATWKISRFGELLSMMKMPDATGATLLDGSAVIGLSELGASGSHSSTLLPVIVAGNAGAMGTPAARGQHLQYPCPMGAPLGNFPTIETADAATCSGTLATRTPIARLWLSALRGLGVEARSFAGETSTLSGLWA